MPKSLVLGGNGFIGSHLCDYLAGLRHQVTCFDRFSREPLFHHPEVKVIVGDFLKIKDLERALEGIEYVFHFASASTPYSSVQKPESEIKDVLMPTLRLLNLCAKNKVKKIIFPSSGGLIYGKAGEMLGRVSEDECPAPLVPHAITKLAIEKFLLYFFQEHKLDYCVLRFSNIYGPRAPLRGNQGVVSIFMNAVLNNKRPVIFGDGHSIRDYLYITDALKAIALAAAKESDEKIFNVGSDEGFSILEVLDRIMKIAQKNVKPIFKNPRQFQINRIVLDSSKFRKKFIWKPETDFETGLKHIHEWLVHEPVLSRNLTGVTS